MSLRSVVDVVAPLLLTLWICVEGYNAILGRASFRVLRAKEAEIAALEAETAALTARRDALERRADMLNRRGLDLDLLEERARAVLGYAAEGERVMPRDQVETLLGESR